MSEADIEDNNGDSNNIRPSSPSELESDYDPHAHRDMKNATSNFVTFTHMLKAIIGTGIFAMPNALRQTGYAIGISGGVIIGMLLTHCIHSVVQSQYILCKRHRQPVLDYQMTMKLALQGGPHFLRCMAPYSNSIVDVFVLIMSIGISSIYVIFTAQNIVLVSNLSEDIDYVRIFIVVLLLPLIGLALIRNLKILAPFSTLATIVTVVGICLIFSYLFRGLGPISKIEPVGSVLGFPFFFGTTLFALVAMNLVLSLENKMRTPKSFVAPFGVVNLVMGISTGLYMLFGFFGYWQYNIKLKDMVTENLPSTDIAPIVIQALFALSLFLSSGLYIFSSFEIIWKRLSKYFKNQFRGEMIVRVSLAIFIFLISVAYQEIGIIISFIGAVCMSMLAITFPALIKICVMYPNFGRCQNILIWNSLLIIIGIIAMVAGIANSVVGV